jgi:hypothetical protein
MIAGLLKIAYYSMMLLSRLAKNRRVFEDSCHMLEDVADTIYWDRRVFQR